LGLPIQGTADLGCPAAVNSTVFRHLRHELPLRFEGRIFSVDRRIAEAWGRTVSRSKAMGRPTGAMDAFLSATAETHRLTLVTRNVSGFSVLKAALNPWS
jgi:hypothetical protein